MSTICADQQPHRHHIEIPPTKHQLLLRRNNKLNTSFDHATCHLFTADELLNHQKFLQFNNSIDGDMDNDCDSYASDHFRIYEFKIRRCTRSRSHDWTDCPLAHPGEKARRRDPRRYHYSGTICSEFRRGGACSRGDDCEFAHGVFECWLHPSRYRTEACKDGKNCKRKICFFAHTPHQLRILPEIIMERVKHTRGTSNKNQSHCCVYCRSQLTNCSNSPTSTLFGVTSHLSHPLSPSLSPSPPLSPLSQRGSPITRDQYRLSKFGHVSNFGLAPTSYKDNSLTELMNSLEAMNLNHEPISPNFKWVDVNFANDIQDQQQQFVLSPSTPATARARNLFNNGDPHQYSRIFANDDNGGGLIAGSSSLDPDLDWINDLLK